MRALIVVLFGSALALTACSQSESEVDSATGNQAVSTAAPDAVTADGTYKASCINKYSQIDLSLEIAGGKIAKLSGTIDSKNGKLRPGAIVTTFNGALTAAVTRVDAVRGTARTVIEASAKLAPWTLEDVKLKDDDYGDTETVKTCRTTASIPSIEIRTKNEGNAERGVTLTHVAVADEACLGDSPLDELANWEVGCGEDDGSASAEGLTAFVDALKGAKPKAR
jgi:uncharacterized protein with FMN-binding domain